MVFSAKEAEFYRAHLNLAQVGRTGQEKLKTAKVLLVGLGGLGSPAATYLAAAGIGTIGLIDHDTVSISNLHRQILHNMEDLGRWKVDSAKDKLSKLNPFIEIQTYTEKLSPKNALTLFGKYDLILDGSDNFQTRYLVNDTCIALKKPFIHGSVHSFEGSVTFFDPAAGPCYRCLHKEPPQQDDCGCAETGILGVLPGIIGQLQACEAIKFFLKRGISLQGRLLHYNALHQNFREIALKKDPSCSHEGIPVNIGCAD